MYFYKGQIILPFPIKIAVNKALGDVYQPSQMNTFEFNKVI
jgi:hypothetical protein